jgi:aldehyde:ferredoxin oxidoreductase
VPGKPDVYVEGPEYETIALIGGSCAFKSIHEVAYANNLLDNVGMDTMSGGSTVAFAMECYQRGLITKDDLEGHELRWGNIDDFEHVIDMIVHRRGLGDALAHGTKGAAERIGKGSIHFASQAKGMEFSGYDTRWYPAQLLSYCTCDIGAHHSKSWAITADIELGRTSRPRSTSMPSTTSRAGTPLSKSASRCPRRYGTRTAATTSSETVGPDASSISHRDAT